MIINNAPANEAVLSNVGAIGEFRIRNSAKAFNILSSGLYANKIRAVIRELSCNAVDSHVAAGRADVPFDVHLPNRLEPWFSVRDYGTGLSHDEVTNIYTTYFDSTKTASNDFIGALGLGSKSPFSYTDNFTVTAIKNNRRGVYSAFINAEGVPSIALMTEETTTEPNGVEVKFAVSDQHDNRKFENEAADVYKYFKLQPVVSGNSDFAIKKIEYETRDIIPGVHSMSKMMHHSVAVMGNIAYPIEIPSADESLKDLRKLLSCGLEMHFEIGELDFQASREGLSYIPQTVEAIKRKLEAVNKQLTIHITEEANKIENLWERTDFLITKSHSYLWINAVQDYIMAVKLPTMEIANYTNVKTLKIETKRLEKQFNISMRGFNIARNSKVTTTLNTSTIFNDKQKRDRNGRFKYPDGWHISINPLYHFIINDTNVGALERSKYHYRSNSEFNRNVYVIEAYNKALPVKTDEFFKFIFNPPKANIILASTLKKKERAAGSGIAKNVTIMRLEDRGGNNWGRYEDKVWRDAGKADTFADNVTYYYVPLKGFEFQSEYKWSDIKHLSKVLTNCGISKLNVKIYGVRKADIEFIKTKKNWVNLESHIANVLSQPLDNNLVMNMVVQALDKIVVPSYNSELASMVRTTSPYNHFMNKFKGYDRVHHSESNLKQLYNTYAEDSVYDPKVQVQHYVAEAKTVSIRYPMLSHLRSNVPNDVLADYINMIDTQKGI